MNKKFTKTETPDAPDYRESAIFAKFVSDVENCVKNRSTRKRIVTWRILRECFNSHSYVCRRCIYQKIGEAVEASNHLRVVSGKHCEIIEFSEKEIIEADREVRRYSASISPKGNTADWGSCR